MVGEKTHFCNITIDPDLTPEKVQELITKYPPSPMIPQDHITYDRTDGWARWLFDTNTNNFQSLHLPFYFAKAPQCIKTELTEYCRRIAMGTLPDTFPLPEHVKEWRDSPSTKALRSAAKTGQASLEAWE